MDYSYKKIWLITYPVLISLVMEHMIGLTDTAFLGRVGEVELGASALGGIFYLVTFMIGFGFSIGAEILMGRRNGEGRYLEIGKIFHHGTVALLIMASAMFALSTAFSPVLLRNIIESDAVYEATIKYTQWRMYGLFFSFTASMFRSYYMATTNTKILTINSLVMVMSNVVLNYILIFGKLGIPAMGIAGAAIASSISEGISLVFFVIYTRYKTNYKKYGLFRRIKYSPGILRQTLNVSGWTMIQQLISSSTWLFFFIATEHLGEHSLAISNMVRSISSLLYLSVSAFATTGSAMVSNLMGNGKQNEVMKLCLRIIKMCCYCTLPFYLFIIAFPQLTLRIYTDNLSLIADSLPSLYVMLVSVIVALPGFVYFLAISGTGNTRAAFIIEMIALFFYVGYIYLAAFWLELPVEISWIVESIYGFVLLAGCYLFLKKSNWKQKAI